MQTLPIVTDAEISSLMDFDALLRKKNQLIKQRRNLRKLKIVAAIIALIATPALVLLLPLRFTQPSASLIKQNLPSSPSATNAGIDTARSQVPQDSSVRKDLTPSSKGTKHVQPAAPVISGQERRQSKESNPVLPSIPVYHQAEPAEGYPALYQYFNTNLIYPQAALKDSLQGIVNVVFVIDVEGRPADIAIETSLGPLLDKEAMRLVQQMPLWKPASYDGKPVRSKISLPITFELQKISTP